MEGLIWINNEKIGEVESLKVNKSMLLCSNTKVIKPMSFECSFECKGECKIENTNKFLQTFLPNFKKVKKLLYIARHTKKVRIKKKIYIRAYGLTRGLPLKVYE